MERAAIQRAPRPFQWLEFEVKGEQSTEPRLDSDPRGLASKDWTYFAIDRPALDQLERLVNDLSEDEESPLESFLRRHLVVSTPWVLVFEPQGDQINRVFKGEIDWPWSNCERD